MGFDCLPQANPWTPASSSPALRTLRSRHAEPLSGRPRGKARDPNDLAASSGTGGHEDGGARDAQPFRQQPAQRVVRGAIDRRRGHTHPDFIAAEPPDLAPGGSRLYPDPDPHTARRGLDRRHSAFTTTTCATQSNR